MNTGGRKSDFVKFAPTHNAIELGGGDSPLYHPNIDIYKSPQVDIVQNITNGIPLPNDSVELIFSRDFAEHLLFSDFLKLLKECKRILKNGGCIKFAVPDVYKAVKTHMEYNEHTKHCLVGTWDKERPEMLHKMWWTPEIITYVLEHEGWVVKEIFDYILDSDHWKEPKFMVVAECRK